MTAPPAPQPLGRATRLTLGLGVALISLGTVEMVLRTALGPPPPALRVFGVLAPDKDYWERSGDTIRPAWSGETGDVGAGDLPCATNRPRLLAMGGSSVHGGSEGVAVTSEFPSVAGRRLGIEVHNAGFPGFDSNDLLAVAEGFGDCEAEGFIVYAGHNDLGNITFNSRYGSVQAGLQLRALSLLQRLQLYTQLSRALGPIQGVERHDEDQTAFDGISPARRARALADFEANLRRIAWLAARDDRVMLLIGAVSDLTEAPPLMRCDGSVCPDEEERRSWGEADPGESPEEAARRFRQAWDDSEVAMRATSEVHAIMRSIAEDEPHVYYLDAEAELPREPGLDLPARALFSDGLHFSAEGHRQLGQLVADALQSPLRGDAAPRAKGKGGGKAKGKTRSKGPGRPR